MTYRRIPVICFVLFSLLALCGCAAQSTEKSTEKGSAEASLSCAWENLASEGLMDLGYAEEFSVEKLSQDYRLITIGKDEKYLVIPEGTETPQGLPEEIVPLKQPFDHTYLVATSAMDLICTIGAVDQVTLSGTKAENWYVEEAQAAMEAGRMTYAGKYSAPDYESILADGCNLAIESTMIYHAPKVKEELEQLGIPVLVERSSYESHPLGRLEWIKLYGVLYGKEAEAEAYYRQQMDSLNAVLEQEKTKKTVAFFSLPSNGAVTVRKSGDYVSKMIELAGGDYIFHNLGNDDELSTINLQMETFYKEAKDADVLIYNSTITGEAESLEKLIEKQPLLADFKAVKEGNVYCTEEHLFQKSTGIGDLIRDMNKIFHGEEKNLQYLFPLM